MAAAPAFTIESALWPIGSETEPKAQRPAPGAPVDFVTS
jgi:hypothetical protein